MADDVIKSLKWLIFNFPEIENPKDDADKISNCIHLYCQNAVDELNRQQAEIENLRKVILNGEFTSHTAEKVKEEYCCSVIDGHKPLKRPPQSWCYVEKGGER